MRISLLLDVDYLKEQKRKRKNKKR